MPADRDPGVTRSPWPAACAEPARGGRGVVADARQEGADLVAGHGVEGVADGRVVRLGLADGNAASGLVVLFRGGEIAWQWDLVLVASGLFGVDGQYDFVRATFTDGKGGTVTPGFLTPHWYRVSALTPRLRAGLRVSRHPDRRHPTCGRSGS